MCVSKYNFPQCDHCFLLRQGERSLLAMYVRHIKDLNEITSHMMEVVHSQLGLLGKVIGLMGGTGEMPIMIIV